MKKIREEIRKEIRKEKEKGDKIGRKGMLFEESPLKNMQVSSLNEETVSRGQDRTLRQYSGLP